MGLKVTNYDCKLFREFRFKADQVLYQSIFVENESELKWQAFKYIITLEFPDWFLVWLKNSRRGSESLILKFAKNFCCKINKLSNQVKKFINFGKKWEQDNLVFSLSDLNSQWLFCIFEEKSKRSEIHENWQSGIAFPATLHNNVNG